MLSIHDNSEDSKHLCDYEDYDENASDAADWSDESSDLEEDERSEEEGVSVSEEADGANPSKDNEDRTLVEVPPSHVTFLDIQAQFESQWQRTPVPPKVHKIYSITCSKQHIAKFDRYQAEVGQRIGLANRNIVRYWHGTTRACRVGDNSSRLNPCSSRDCSLCSIMKWSYNLPVRKAYARFGSGIYTSSTSSKAFDYHRELGGSKYGALLLNEVVAGNPLCLTDSCPDFTQLPSGYDSVQVIPGRSLVYDEYVVYTEAAIRPVYLVLCK
ncbi:uncharacterized protein PHACADRAFT_254491 [Phanerochaete carnosa HHB-10118-sp]|uniref:PARP catalytic domain-containing protein n=1 Tax=Phanerochaete carnosa (strain HHB-10118-sp) TaxID=650164 RepID=K5X2I9_PHACS|nr:uncharacterized protein PHACADRAFT_254491 [Phanerochaete carnosa HHB-10118-sp]EKM57017.1 hypothetical protein PHACADRAFT_254491 [Phanerochaete carnosa HHB-10118-sp]